MVRSALVPVALLVAATTACTDQRSGRTAPRLVDSESRPGGRLTRAFRASTFLRPPVDLASEAKSRFYAGKALAGQPWVRAPSITDARDGLGPLYEARTCFACHVGGGRGPAADRDGRLAVATVVRLERRRPGGPRDDRRGARSFDPRYGEQLQTRAIGLAALRTPPEPRAGEIVPEAEAFVRWARHDFRYPDDQVVSLRRPRLEIRSLGYGPLGETTHAHLRHAPPLHGAGLIDAVEARAIEAWADPADEDGDGISGRVRWVADPESNEPRVGRFGLRADQPSLEAQVASALHGDMGITSSLFPHSPCTAHQSACLAAPDGADASGVEIRDELLERIVDFTRLLPVPSRRKPDHPMVLRGRTQFHASGCASCHRPRFETGRHPDHPELSEQTIWPYADFLLHDMGPDLARGTTASPEDREWRTPPLWGVGLARAVREAAGFLHDGRARSVEEAILWHAGEAEASRAHFIRLPRDDRRALVAFVKSL